MKTIIVLLIGLVLLSCGWGEHSGQDGQYHDGIYVCALNAVDIGMLAVIGAVILLRKKLKFIALGLILFMLTFAGDCDDSDVHEVGGDGDKYGYTTESDKDDTVIYGRDEKQAKKNKKEYDKEIYPELEKQRKENF